MASKTLDIVAVARRVAAEGRRRRTLRIAAGAGAMALGLAQRGVLGSVFALGGLALLVRTATGRPLGETVTLLAGKLGLTASERFGGGQRDTVDEASWESFPASDPPAHSPVAYRAGRSVGSSG